MWVSDDYRIGMGGYLGYDGCYKGDFVMLVSFRVKNFRSFVDKALELRCEEGKGRAAVEGQEGGAFSPEST